MTFSVDLLVFIAAWMIVQAGYNVVFDLQDNQFLKDFIKIDVNGIWLYSLGHF